MKKRKLFIGNLNYAVTADKLRSFLAKHGNVIDVKMMEGKGYAFVEMGSEEQAQKILTTLSETVFEGRKLLIDGVPGTRRSDKKPDKNNPDFREKRPALESGKRTYSSPPGEERKSPKPPWKNTKTSGEPRSSSRPERPRTEGDTRSKIPPGQNQPKPVSSTPVGSSAKKQQGQPEAPQKTQSQSLKPAKKSKVPAWVKEKRSPRSKK